MNNPILEFLVEALILADSRPSLHARRRLRYYELHCAYRSA